MRTTIAVLSAAAVLAALPAFAQQTDREAQRPTTQQTQAPAGQQQSFAGSIRGTRTVNIEGQRHVLAKVRNQAGNDLVVDLGPVADLKQKNVRLKRNQRISGQGAPGRIDGRPILVVHTFTTQAADGRGSQTVQPRAQARAHRDFKHVVQGKVVDTRGVELKAAAGEHNLMKLQSGQKEIVVDLGPAQTAEQLGLQQGDKAIVVGDMARIQGRPVLFASSVAELKQIERSAK